MSENADFLQWDLGSLPVQALVDPGKYLVNIKKADIKVADTGREGINIMFIIPDNPNALPIWNTWWFPKEGDDPSKAKVTLGMLRDFYDGMGYDYSNITGFDAAKQYVEELIDLQSTASVGYTPANDAKGWAAKNTIKALVPVN